MLRYQPEDTVWLKHDHNYIGSVTRTNSYDGLTPSDCLMFALTEIPAFVLEDFAKTGTPPRGYVYVQFARQEHGSALLSEDDVELVDRSLDLGDVVKQDGSNMTGTVVNVASRYVLQPVWLHASNEANPDQFKAIHIDQLQPDLSAFEPLSLQPHATSSMLLNEVSFDELKRARDFMEGDYVIYQDWIGIVEYVVPKVVLRLDDGAIVAIENFDRLYLPIPELDRPIVSLPDYDDIPRPSIVSTMQGWPHLIPATELNDGDLVVTDMNNLKNGRWLRGAFNPESTSKQGRILMVRAQSLEIHWLVCNAYTPIHHWDAKKPPTNIYPYENIDRFPAPQELRRDRNLVLYDPGRPCISVHNRMRSAILKDNPQIELKHINLSSTFGCGDRVKFRNATTAAEHHPSWARIEISDSSGYDLNEFSIVHQKQTAIVQWQDGTTSIQESIRLIRTELFENDLAPGDIVVAREGMKMRAEPPSDEQEVDLPLHDFNEMIFFEKRHDLFPAKVGIIQEVTVSERVAQVRWFICPKIRVTAAGNALGSESRFGAIGSLTEDVSLFEVMSFSAFNSKLRDIVTFQPEQLCREAVNVIQNFDQDDLKEIRAAITPLSQFPSLDTIDISEWVQHNAAGNHEISDKTKLVDLARYKPHHNTDWVGEICERRLDGTMRIRVIINDSSQDVLLEYDQVLALVDNSDDYLGDEDIDEMDHDDEEDSESEMDDDSDYSIVPEEVISERVEYEGGERVDNDSGDENWESADEEMAAPEIERAESPQTATKIPMDKTTISEELDEMDIDVDLQSKNTSVKENRVAQEVDATPSKKLRTYLSSSAPPQFDVLTIEPPIDQFRRASETKPSTAFLKRVAKECKQLRAGLPQNQIYVRTYESRLDLLRILLIGPPDTAYEDCPFLIDLYLPSTFPAEPPVAHFHSWTSGLGRINPNLYEEGKICLSLLGTWPGKGETETWSEKSTILQLLVSLQGLVFVKKPFYNEAGFEGYEESGEYKNESAQYTERAYVMARNFLRHAIERPVAVLEDVIAWTYLNRSNDGTDLLQRVISRSRSLITKSEQLKISGVTDGNQDDITLDGEGNSTDSTKTFLRPLSKGASVVLSKTLIILESLLKEQEVS